jgi:chromosome segregation ATPase
VSDSYYDEWTEAEREVNDLKEDKRLLKQEVKRLREELSLMNQHMHEDEDEVDRLQRQLSACKDIDKELGVLRETVERLYISNSRYRKAVNWMRGCFDKESWEYKRATAVLEEEADAKETEGYYYDETTHSGYSV